MENITLHIIKVDGETEPALRRRTARAILALLERDKFLSQEVAMLLDISPHILDWRVDMADKTETEYIDL